METAITQELTGYEKFRQAGLAYYRFYKDYPEIFRLMNYIGYIRVDAEDSPKLKEFLKFDNTLFESWLMWLRKDSGTGVSERILKRIREPIRWFLF